VLLKKLVEAEGTYQQALKGKEKALGPEHTSTLCIVNNLGSLYRDQGKLVEAEVMYQQALKGYKKALGPEHIKCDRLRKAILSLEASQGKIKFRSL
jgi:tetratricopeptide (TPR) repeat protein